VRSKIARRFERCEDRASNRACNPRYGRAIFVPHADTTDLFAATDSDVIPCGIRFEGAGNRPVEAGGAVFSPEGATIATSGRDGTVTLRTVASSSVERLESAAQRW
jgi:hypothetical protein